MSWREEYRYYAQCAKVPTKIADSICDEIEEAFPIASPDEKYALAGERFWPVIWAMN